MGNATPVAQRSHRRRVHDAQHARAHPYHLGGEAAPAIERHRRLHSKHAVGHAAHAPAQPDDASPVVESAHAARAQKANRRHPRRRPDARVPPPRAEGGGQPGVQPILRDAPRDARLHHLAAPVPQRIEHEPRVGLEASDAHGQRLEIARVLAPHINGEGGGIGGEALGGVRQKPRRLLRMRALLPPRVECPQRARLAESQSRLLGAPHEVCHLTPRGRCPSEGGVDHPTCGPVHALERLLPLELHDAPCHKRLALAALLASQRVHDPKQPQPLLARRRPLVEGMRLVLLA